MSGSSFNSSDAEFVSRQNASFLNSQSFPNSPQIQITSSNGILYVTNMEESDAQNMQLLTSKATGGAPTQYLINITLSTTLEDMPVTTVSPITPLSEWMYQLSNINFANALANDLCVYTVFSNPNPNTTIATTTDTLYSLYPNTTQTYGYFKFYNFTINYGDSYYVPAIFPVQPLIQSYQNKLNASK